MVIVTTLLVVGHAAWLRRFRHGGPVDIDEAGYLGFAFQTTSATHRLLTGPFVLWRASPSGPLLALLTAPVQFVLGRSVDACLLANLAFFVLLVAATYSLARAFCPPWWAALAAVVVATAPGVTDASRAYNLSLASTSLYCVAVLALVRSDHFGSRRWSAAFGIGLGMLLLSRTIMLAFAPGLVLAACLAASRASTDARPAAWRRLGVALVTSVVIAGSWYVLSAGAVWRYLVGTGYGARSLSAAAQPITSAAFWLTDLVDGVSRGLYVPVAVVLVVGAVLGLSGLRGPVRACVRRVWATDVPLLLVPALTAFVALLTVRNISSGFSLPLVPLGVVLASALTSRARLEASRMAVAGALSVLCLLNVVMTSGTVAPLARARLLWSTSWARLPITDGEPLIASYLMADGGYRWAGRHDRVPSSFDAWIPAGRRLARSLDAPHATGDGAERVLMTVEGPMVNTNLIFMVDEQDDVVPPTLDVIDGARARGPGGLERYLQVARRQGVDAVVTGPASLAWPDAQLPQRVVEQATSDAGYHRHGVVELPDGRSVTIWSL